MIRISRPISRKVSLALSGGLDSMVVYDFLRRNHQVTPLFVHHGTDASEAAYRFLIGKDIPNLKVTRIDGSVPKGRSAEDWWREKRYEVFHSVTGNVITAHHLDDCIETWIWSSAHGKPSIIPYCNKNVIRPFRSTPKSEFLSWAQRHQVDWVDDPSNEDTKFMRNYIRHNVVSHMKVINPGIEKVIAKKVESEL